MARRILNRKALRDENDAAESMESQTSGGDEGDDGDDDGPAKKKAAKKKAAPRTRAKAAKKVVRLKAFWGVFNQAMKRVAVFDFSQKSEADKKAEALTTSQKSPHFVQGYKEQIQE